MELYYGTAFAKNTSLIGRKECPYLVVVDTVCKVSYDLPRNVDELEKPNANVFGDQIKEGARGSPGPDPDTE